MEKTNVTETTIYKLVEKLFKVYYQIVACITILEATVGEEDEVYVNSAMERYFTALTNRMCALLEDIYVENNYCMVESTRDAMTVFDEDALSILGLDDQFPGLSIKFTTNGEIVLSLFENGIITETEYKLNNERFRELVSSFTTLRKIARVNKLRSGFVYANSFGRV